MTTAADRLKQQALNANKRNTSTKPATNVHEEGAGETKAAVTSPPRAPGNVRVKPTRKNVDLSAAEYKDLESFERQARDELGVARVHSQQVLLALLRELKTNGSLQAAVVERLRDHYQR